MARRSFVEDASPDFFPAGAGRRQRFIGEIPLNFLIKLSPICLFEIDVGARWGVGLGIGVEREGERKVVGIQRGASL